MHFTCGILSAYQKPIPKTMKRTFELWTPVFLWAAVIFTLSTLTNPKASDFFALDFIAKKIAHVSEYAILYMLLLRATGKNFVSSFVITILYAISDEIHQGFTPGRSPAIYDVGLDASGAGIAGYITWKFEQSQRKKHKK